MFPFHEAFSLGMIALTGGTALYAWSASQPSNAGMGFAKLIGILVVFFSIISTTCTIYYGIKYWSAGYFQTPMAMPMMQRNMINGTGMPKGMMGMQDMMDKCMKDCKSMSGNMNNTSQTTNQGHETHHP